MYYSEYVDKWLDGLSEEILFWDDYMESSGGNCVEDYNWIIDADKRFPFENEIGENGCRFLDIGSGPFSRCGHKTFKKHLEFNAIDPLAVVYELLKKRHHVNNGIVVNQGFVELLDKQYPEDSFDIVHMSNALDHSFDPVFGIKQMLRVCKINGKVILRHSENEAENANYEGLHQWNLSLHRKEGSFVIWNKDIEIDITKEFSPYASIVCCADIQDQESTSKKWVYNKVVLTKKREVLIDQNEYLFDFFEGIYGRLMKIIFELCDGSPFKSITLRKKHIISQLEDIEKNGLEVNNTDFENGVMIYGMGDIGKSVYRILKSNGIDVNQLLDRNSGEYDGYVYGRVHEKKYNGEMIIVTAPAYFDEIKNELNREGISDEKIINIEFCLANWRRG